jgi:hypothetical protein
VDLTELARHIDERSIPWSRLTYFSAGAQIFEPTAILQFIGIARARGSERPLEQDCATPFGFERIAITR